MKTMVVTSGALRVEMRPLDVTGLIDDMEKFDQQGYLLTDEYSCMTAQSPLNMIFRSSMVPQIISNPIYHLFRARNPEALVPEQARYDPVVTARVFVVHSFIFVRNVIVTFQPHLYNSLSEITEAHAYIAPDSIPPRFATALLEYITHLETIALNIHHGIQKLPTGDDLRSIIYRSLGWREEALEASRRSVSTCVQFLNGSAVSTVFRVILPLFLDGCCFIQFGAFESLDTILPTLQTYAPFYSFALQAQNVLLALRAKSLAIPPTYTSSSSSASSSSSQPLVSFSPQPAFAIHPSAAPFSPQPWSTFLSEEPEQPFAAPPSQETIPTQFRFVNGGLPLWELPVDDFSPNQGTNYGSPQPSGDPSFSSPSFVHAFPDS